VSRSGRRTTGRPALSKRLREQLTRRQRQEEQEILRRYEERPVDDGGAAAVDVSKRASSIVG